MLTYTEDGEVTAKNIAKVLRASEPRIGVVILDEQEKHVYSRAEGFVDDCFKQVSSKVKKKWLNCNIRLLEGYTEKIFS